MHTSSAPPERHHYLDALRVMVIGLLVIFHTGLVFTPFFDFVVVNAGRSLGIALLTVALVHPWQMPLMFFISGMSAWFALGRRSAGQFAAERVKRLLLPFIVGFALLIPPQVYFSRVLRGQFAGSLADFLPLYFTEGFTQGYISWHHLWFILYLFVLLLAALPLFLIVRNHNHGSQRDGLAALASRPGLIFLGCVPIALTEIAFRGRYPGGYYNLVSDWANVSLFLIALIYGFMAASDARILEAIDRVWKIGLAAAVGLTGGFLILVWRTGAPPVLGYEQPLYVLYSALSALNTWCWIVGIVGLARRLIRRGTAFLSYASRMAYPFYIFHQTILVAIAFYVVQLDLSVWLKYALIAAPTFALTALAVQAVRLTPVTRFMVGIKAERQGLGIRDQGLGIGERGEAV